MLSHLHLICFLGDNVYEVAAMHRGILSGCFRCGIATFVIFYHVDVSHLYHHPSEQRPSYIIMPRLCPGLVFILCEQPT